jgi:hypothetical protein
MGTGSFFMAPSSREGTIREQPYPPRAAQMHRISGSRRAALNSFARRSSSPARNPVRRPMSSATTTRKCSSRSVRAGFSLSRGTGPAGATTAMASPGRKAGVGPTSCVFVFVTAAL